MDLKQTNEILQLLVFVAAIIGAPFAIYKFFKEGRRQRQIMADDLYQRYLERAMDHPKLGWPEGKLPPDAEYPWFVAIMCNALAAQINCEPSMDMREALKCDLKVHRKYFESDDFKNEGGWKLYPSKLKELYDEII